MDQIGPKHELYPTDKWINSSALPSLEQHSSRGGNADECLWCVQEHSKKNPVVTKKTLMLRLRDHMNVFYIFVCVLYSSVCMCSVSLHLSGDPVCDGLQVSPAVWLTGYECVSVSVVPGIWLDAAFRDSLSPPLAVLSSLPTSLPTNMFLCEMLYIDLQNWCHNSPDLGGVDGIFV